MGTAMYFSRLMTLNAQPDQSLGASRGGSEGATPPALTFLDWQMPGADGIEVTRTL
jgi:CheY-like chemotaxis protein